MTTLLISIIQLLSNPQKSHKNRTNTCTVWLPSELQHVKEPRSKVLLKNLPLCFTSFLRLYTSQYIKLTIILTVEAAELMFPHSAHYKAMDHLCPSQVCVHNDTSSATHSWYLSHSRRTQRQSFSVLTLFSYREGVHHHPTDRHEFSQETKYNRVCHSLLSTSIIQEMRAK